jgi:hypothetical protein
MTSKSIQISGDIHAILRLRKERTGVPIVRQIAQLVEGVRYEQVKEVVKGVNGS